MEWVETTSKSVEEAKELALDKLGIDDADAEFEILEEPRQGLFGRTRGQARVRARIAPQSPRSKEERGRRRRKPRSGSKQNGAKQGGSKQGGQAKQQGRGSGGRKGGSDDSESAQSDSADQGQAKSSNRGGRGGSRGSTGRGDKSEASGQRQRNRRPQRSNSPKKEDASMEEVSACVETFLSGLVDAFDIDTKVVIDTSNDEIMAQIEGKHGLLLGPKARTLDAIQELTRVTAQRTVPSSIRIKVDVGGYRLARKASLEEFARGAGEKAVEESMEVVLEPMSSADRKIIHDELNDFAGVSTRSAGTDPRRRVVVVPDETQDESPDEDVPVVSEDETGDASEDAE